MISFFIYKWRLLMLNWFRRKMIQQGLTCRKSNQSTNQPTLADDDQTENCSRNTWPKFKEKTLRNVYKERNRIFWKGESHCVGDIYTYIHTHIHTHTHTHTYIYICMYFYKYVWMYKYVCIYISMYVCMYIYKHVYMYIYKYVRIYIY